MIAAFRCFIPQLGYLTRNAAQKRFNHRHTYIKTKNDEKDHFNLYFNDKHGPIIKSSNKSSSYKAPRSTRGCCDTCTCYQAGPGTEAGNSNTPYCSRKAGDSTCQKSNSLQIIPNYVNIYSMKKIVFITMLAAGIAINSAQAQSKLTDEQKSELKARFNAYKENLNLTGEQSEKVRSIDSAYIMGLAALKKSESGRVAKYKQFKNLNATRDDKMKSVLNKDQYKAYTKFRKEMKAEFKEIRQAQ